MTSSSFIYFYDQTNTYIGVHSFLHLLVLVGVHFLVEFIFFIVHLGRLFVVVHALLLVLFLFLPFSLALVQGVEHVAGRELGSVLLGIYLNALAEVLDVVSVGVLDEQGPESHFQVLEVVLVFILVLPGLPVPDRVRVVPDTQFDPPPLLPVLVELQVDAELPGDLVEVYFVVEDCTNLLVLAVVDFDSADASVGIQHFAPDLNPVVAWVHVLDLHDGQFARSHQDHNHDG